MEPATKARIKLRPSQTSLRASGSRLYPRTKQPGASEVPRESRELARKHDLHNPEKVQDRQSRYSTVTMSLRMQLWGLHLDKSFASCISRPWFQPSRPTCTAHASSPHRHVYFFLARAFTSPSPHHWEPLRSRPQQGPLPRMDHTIELKPSSYESASGFERLVYKTAREKGSYSCLQETSSSCSQILLERHTHQHYQETQKSPLWGPPRPQAYIPVDSPIKTCNREYVSLAKLRRMKIEYAFYTLHDSASHFNIARSCQKRGTVTVATPIFTAPHMRLAHRVVS